MPTTEPRPSLPADWVESSVMLVGPPGVGSMGASEGLADALGLPHVSTGDLIESAIRSRTALGHAAQPFVQKGLLLPDRLVLRLVDRALRTIDDAAAPRHRRFMLVGAPRTIRQAEALTVLTSRSPACVVVHLHASDRVVRAALAAGCSGSGDRTRAQRRLSSYRMLTLPALAWIARRRPVVTVDATLPADEQRSALLQSMGELCRAVPRIPA
jgi:adenylate kinase